MVKIVGVVFGMLKTDIEYVSNHYSHILHTVSKNYPGAMASHIPELLKLAQEFKDDSTRVLCIG